MCGELLLSCAIRSSACNYTSCAHELIYRLNLKMSEYNVICVRRVATELRYEVVRLRL